MEIELNNINTSNNISKNNSRINTNKKYKKNISEHDLVNSILNTFSNYNIPKGVNLNINYSSKKNMSKDKIRNKSKGDYILYNNSSKKNIIVNNMRDTTKNRHSSDTKILRSNSGYSYINNKLSQTNSFFNGNNQKKLENKLGYISTWGNSPDHTNTNLRNIIKYTNPNNKSKSKKQTKSNKGPIIGKIIKNYKNNDLNYIFNMNLIPPVSPINNIQDYIKNLYKFEYNSDGGRIKNNKRNNNSKKSKNNINEARDKEMKTKTNNDDYSQSKNTMTKTSEFSKKRERDSIENFKYNNESPEEIHFYVISSIQNGKNRIYNLNKK